MQTTSVCYINGNYAFLEKASISPMDLGFLRGYSVFDALVFERKSPRLFDKHWKRLESCAREMHMKVPVSEREARVIVERLIEMSGLISGSVRTIISGGISENGFTLLPGRETFCVIVGVWKRLDPVVYREGVSVITAEHLRAFPHIKTSDYLYPLYCQQRRVDSQAFEILYVWNGNVLEASTSNFFLVSGGMLVTAKKNIFPGITREIVLDIARVHPNIVGVEERDISLEELIGCQEAFLTGSAKGVVPISTIDNRTLPQVPGKVTSYVMKEYDALFAFDASRSEKK